MGRAGGHHDGRAGGLLGPGGSRLFGPGGGRGDREPGRRDGSTGRSAGSASIVVAASAAGRSASAAAGPTAHSMPADRRASARARASLSARSSSTIPQALLAVSTWSWTGVPAGRGQGPGERPSGRATRGRAGSGRSGPRTTHVIPASRTPPALSRASATEGRPLRPQPPTRRRVRQRPADPPVRRAPSAPGRPRPSPVSRRARQDFPELLRRRGHVSRVPRFPLSHHVPHVRDLRLEMRDATQPREDPG